MHTHICTYLQGHRWLWTVKDQKPWPHLYHRCSRWSSLTAWTSPSPHQTYTHIHIHIHKITSSQFCLSTLYVSLFRQNFFCELVRKHTTARAQCLSSSTNSSLWRHSVCSRRQEPVVTAAALRNLHLITQHSALPLPPHTHTRIYTSSILDSATRKLSSDPSDTLETTQWPSEKLWKLLFRASDYIRCEKTKWLRSVCHFENILEAIK